MTTHKKEQPNKIQITAITVVILVTVGSNKDSLQAWTGGNPVKTRRIELSSVDRIGMEQAKANTMSDSPPYSEAVQKRLQERDRPVTELYSRALNEYNLAANPESCYQDLIRCEELAAELRILADAPASMRLRAKILVLQGKYQEALATYLKQAHGDHREMSTLEALCYLKLGNFEKARPAFPNDEITTAKCLKPKELPNPNTAQGLEACLWFTLAMEESMQAPLRQMDFYKKAEVLAPNSAGILYYQARTMEELDYSYEAIQAKYEKAYLTADGLKVVLQNRVAVP